MATFIPYQKLSRKKQRALDNAKRAGWGAVLPVTRRPERSDAYNRNKENRRWQADARGERANHGGFYAA